MLIPATLTVNFIANYSGQHRVCWRIQGMPGPFICTNIVDCVGGGNVCSAVINIMVDPESCATVIYEGYIQATCNPEGSGTGQIPWVESFIPNPTCKGYSITTNYVCTIPPQLGVIVPSVDMGLNCNGTARPDLQLYCGSTVRLCATGIIPTLPPGYVMTEAGFCCYDCTNYDVIISPAAPGDFIDGSFFYYIDCNTRELRRQNVSGNVPVVIAGLCAVTGSVSLQLTATATGSIITVGPCP